MIVFAGMDDWLDLVNWNTVLKFGGGVALIAVLGVVYRGLVWLAEKKVATRTAELESKVQNLTETVKTRDDSIVQLRMQIFTLSSTISSQTDSLKLKDEQLVAKQADRDKYHEAGLKEYHRRKALEPYKSAYDKLKKQQELDNQLIESLKQQIINAGGEIGLLIAQLKAREAELTTSVNRFKKARKLDGYLWQAKAMQKRPKFRLLIDRKMPIIAVLNLKGGVGKTTTVAQLAAAFARQGKRVLCVDLDLQGSLTTMLLEQNVISDRFNAGQLLQHFFRNASESKSPKLLNFAQKVPLLEGTTGTLSLVGTTDELAYAEFNLNMSWLLRTGERDARFLLRKALHMKGLASKFDIVLLDCPPVMNISCINALAASDYVLVPSLPSLRSLERVKNLVGVLEAEKFKQHVNQHLKMLGVVANRTHASGLNADQRKHWLDEFQDVKNIHGLTIYRFEATIPMLNAIQDGDTILSGSKRNADVAALFDALQQEIERMLPQ